MAVTELQLSLLALGATAVGGVLAYNAWQARRHRRVAENLVVRRSGDVLLGGSGDPAESALPSGEFVDDRREPRIGDIAESTVERATAAAGLAAEPPSNPLAPPVFEAPVAARDDVLDSPIASAAVETIPVTTDSGSAPESGLLSVAADYIAAFESVEPISGDQIVQSQSDVLRALGKRVAWVGFDEATGVWESCRSGHTYRQIRIGLQLADRHGPLDETELDKFYSAMQRFADEITAVADLPPRRAALESAQRLDRICAGVDIQVGVNVVSKGTPFAGTKLRALAESAGMNIEGDGAYVRRDEDGRLLYAVHALGGEGFSVDTIRSMSTSGLTFLLDVPRVANGDRVFNQMVDVARRFAETLQGQLVDDNRRPITEQFLMPIRKQIGQYQANMAAQGIPAGSDVALRLFS